MNNSFRILSIDFDEKPIKFEIEDVNSKYTFHLSAAEILSADKIVDNFSKHDILMIYYQVIQENEQNQKINIRHIYKAQNKMQGNLYFLPKQGINK